MTLTPKTHGDVPPSNNLFQSGFWARFKETGGLESRSFEVLHDDATFPLVALLRPGQSGTRYAYVPDGPHVTLDDSAKGPFLEELSEELRRFLPDDIACVRYDTTFPSPYTDGEYWSASGQWKGAPRGEIRELRMNFGTRNHALRKSPKDHLCPDTVIVDLAGGESDILSRMRQTTRNGIRRAYKSGVTFRIREGELPSEWYRLYAETSVRKGFYREDESYFHRLFDPSLLRGDASDPAFYALSAEKDGVLLAGVIVGSMGRRGYYLYAGSSLERRDCMPNYGLQWETIRLLRERGCVSYDLMGVPPNGDPRHSMYGLYTFKTGLGGRIEHYAGCWDYPFDPDSYSAMVNAENLG